MGKISEETLKLLEDIGETIVMQLDRIQQITSKKVSLPFEVVLIIAKIGNVALDKDSKKKAKSLISLSSRLEKYLSSLEEVHHN